MDNKSEKRFVGGYKKEEVEEIEWYTKGDRQPVSIDTLFFSSSGRARRVVALQSGT